MRRILFALGAVLVATFAFGPFGPSVWAQSAAGPTIHNVTLDGDVLTIAGVGFGRDPVVTVDGQPVAVLQGGSATHLAVLAPAALTVTPGSYRLTVVDTVGKAGDVFVVATGRVVPGGVVEDTGTPAAEAGSARAHGPSQAAESAARGPAALAAPPPRGESSPQTVIEDSGSPFRTALGFEALLSNAGGTNNTAAGFRALTANTSGGNNTATGYEALRSNTMGAFNTAIGFSALLSNTIGGSNTATGTSALRFNTTGGFNVANGSLALASNTTGSSNTAGGWDALGVTTTGSFNTAAGRDALASNTTGHDNTALGSSAGLNSVSGSWNLFLGAGVTGTSADAYTIRMGLPYDPQTLVGQNRTFIAGIYGTELVDTRQVVIDANGQLGTATGTVIGGGSIAQFTNLEQQVSAQRSQLAEYRHVMLGQQQQLQDQQRVNADLRARLARLEGLLSPSAGGR